MFAQSNLNLKQTRFEWDEHEITDKTKWIRKKSRSIGLTLFLETLIFHTHIVYSKLNQYQSISEVYWFTLHRQPQTLMQIFTMYFPIQISVLAGEVAAFICRQRDTHNMCECIEMIRFICPIVFYAIHVWLWFVQLSRHTYICLCSPASISNWVVDCGIYRWQTDCKRIVYRNRCSIFTYVVYLLFCSLLRHKRHCLT